jgi:hypothetical protein
MVIVCFLIESVGADRLNHDRLRQRLRYLRERQNGPRRPKSREGEQKSDRSTGAQPNPAGRFVYLMVAREIIEAQRTFVLTGATAPELAHGLHSGPMQVGRLSERLRIRSAGFGAVASGASQMTHERVSV